MSLVLFLCLLLPAFLAPGVAAHELRPAYLELRQTRLDTYDVLWKVPARGEDLRLALYVRFPDDCQHTTPRSAMAGGAYVERWRVQRSGGLTGGTIRIDGLSATLTDVLVRVERLDGTTHVTRLTPATPSFMVEAAPGQWQAAATYMKLGVEHILFGVDHLLFLFGLLLIVKDRWTLVKTVSSFTVGHSISLALATLGVVNMPAEPLSAVIALSIVCLAAELVMASRRERTLTIDHPWVVSFGFGLLHGLGFASALVQLGLPTSVIPLALLLFNMGVEIGQLLFVFLVLALLASCRHMELRLPSWGQPIPHYVMGSIAAFWFVDRFVALF
jgi:hydrogenase/urease accessory protein HupE